MLVDTDLILNISKEYFLMISKQIYQHDDDIYFL